MNTHPLARVGHETLVRALRDIFRQSSFGHAITLAGPDSIAVQQIALWVGRCAICEKSEDEPCEKCSGCQSYARDLQEQLILMVPGDNGYTVENIRTLRKTLQLRNKRRVIILHQADKLRGGSANALLKTLEEPLGDIKFILTVSESKSLLPTLRSRTMLFYVQRLSKLNAEKALVEAGYSKNSIEKMLLAYPGMPAIAATMMDKPNGVVNIRSFNELASNCLNMPLFSRLREATALLETSKDINEQRGIVSELISAVARTWPITLRTRQALCEASADLRTNGQPKFILDALLTRV